MFYKPYILSVSLMPIHLKNEKHEKRLYGYAMKTLLFLPKKMALLLFAFLLIISAQLHAELTVKNVEESGTAQIENTDCQNDGEVDIKTATSFHRNPPETDDSCWIDFENADRLHPLWVDVRPYVLQRKSPIPGALHITLSQLEGKTHLKDQLMVLIGSGKDYAEMAIYCHRFKKAGYQKIHILSGGVRAWHQSGQLFPADAETIMALDLISSEDFLYGMVTHSWQIVGVNLEPEAIKYFEGQRFFNISENDLKNIISILGRYLKQPAGTKKTVIVVKDERTLQNLRNMVAGFQDENMSASFLWLAESWRDYKDFLERQRRVSAIAIDPPPLRRPCGT